MTKSSPAPKIPKKNVVFVGMRMSIGLLAMLDIRPNQVEKGIIMADEEREWLTESQCTDLNMVRLGFIAIEKSGWGPVYYNSEVPSVWMYRLGIGWWWVKFKERLRKRLGEKALQWACRVLYREDVGLGGTPRTILAEYDGGGCLEIHRYQPGREHGNGQGERLRDHRPLSQDRQGETG
jgi:hypothetical protein